MKYGVGYDGTYYNAYVTIYNGDGTVVVTHGGIECGQGINTKVQMCLKNLHIKWAQLLETVARSAEYGTWRKI